ncbi:MAG: hypothetical protein HY711_10060 [Candidatus Melainabacteria bacterium]|nr:hypothetical protein [Candidatus Melainabacteria bacterium]
MIKTRAQWPHTIEDITNALDGIWGLVGAQGINGNLFRLERSLHQPLTYTLSEFQGHDEAKVIERKTYTALEKMEALKEFAQALGF